MQGLQSLGPVLRELMGERLFGGSDPLPASFSQREKCGFLMIKYKMIITESVIIVKE